MSETAGERLDRLLKTKAAILAVVEELPEPLPEGVRLEDFLVLLDLIECQIIEAITCNGEKDQSAKGNDQP